MIGFDSSSEVWFSISLSRSMSY
uniref:Uncharacterized protein n=1 Tax=Arundo donax TaxID=35708 RepID=A0A0A8YPE5_ARUDO